MDLNRYTNKAQEALLKSQSLATEHNHSVIEPAHILTALLSQPVKAMATVPRAITIQRSLPAQ